MDGIYLLLGSNLGDKRETINQAIKSINSFAPVITKSYIYETAAWGKMDQPSFYNQVILVNSNLNPEDFLQRLQQIEIALGRQRFEKWGERTIDIDILYFGNSLIKLENLSVPHPEIQNRRFTLVPMNEIAPDFVHPIFQTTQAKLLDDCKDNLQVTKTEWK
ncbi:MAG: 2-amino-4-hydroxy-6-hydroxymethyldihydropteridine diphosphokinase [bacterium]|nr:2-amino-4-hydroxy-6-hydroxymethyldihydropteridine diphosphokinase [bacterium]